MEEVNRLEEAEILLEEEDTMEGHLEEAADLGKWMTNISEEVALVVAGALLVSRTLDSGTVP